MSKLKIIILFISLIIRTNLVIAQCTPASSSNCKDAYILCSVDDLNGYACNLSKNSDSKGCFPLCPSGGIPNNTAWWAFVSNGGEVCITITIGNCDLNNSGMQIGLWGDCECKESIFCDPQCIDKGTKTFCANLVDCKAYYLFVDGCNGNSCNFSITTKSRLTGDPGLPMPLVGPTILCRGQKNIKYSIEPVRNACHAYYQWTLDGTEQIEQKNEVLLDFPDEGDFIVCVTGIVGNPQSGSICNQLGPKCLTVKVRSKFKIGKKSYPCRIIK
ncbi:MAG: hypothetical protein ABIO44_10075 [Saprospiraceae bacterium]